MSNYFLSPVKATSKAGMGLGVHLCAGKCGNSMNYQCEGKDLTQSSLILYLHLL